MRQGLIYENVTLQKKKQAGIKSKKYILKTVEIIAKYVMFKSKTIMIKN